MSPDDLRQEIELKVVEMLKEKVVSGQMSEERSQAIALRVLETLTPGMTLPQLIKAIPTLDDTAPELSPLVIPYLRQYEEGVVKPTEVSVRHMIQVGQFDAAVKLAEEVIKQEGDTVWYGAAKPTES